MVIKILQYFHGVESVQIREFFQVRIFPYSVQIRENADQKKLEVWTLVQCLSKVDNEQNPIGQNKSNT